MVGFLSIQFHCQDQEKIATNTHTHIWTQFLSNGIKSQEEEEEVLMIVIMVQNDKVIIIIPFA